LKLKKVFNISLHDYCGIEGVDRTGIVKRKNCCVLEETVGIKKGFNCDYENQPRGDAYPAV